MSLDESLRHPGESESGGATAAKRVRAYALLSNTGI
jgi:hypothetical protein